MMVQARLFARLREQAGVDHVDLQLPEGATTATAYAELRRRHPGLEADRDLLRPARNQTFCGWEEVLVEGDELALIPPVSGGLQC